MLGKNLIQAAAGNAGAAGGLGVEDVFSTWLYTGNDSTQTITNGIDLSGEGGLVWLKDRTAANSHYLYDTARGATKFLRTNATSAEVTNTDTLTAFNSNGFSIGVFASHNTTGNSISSWTFRKAPGFFDIVTYTGNGSNRTIAHNLGSTPGWIVIKGTSGTSRPWVTYHRSLGADKNIELQSTNAADTNTVIWNNTAPTSTVFSLGTNSNVNANGESFVAYLFAHDEAIFGEGSDQSVVKCGSFTCDGSGNVGTVTLGWEPQYILAKRTDTTQNWYVWDTMRGWDLTNQLWLSPNLSNAEGNAAASYFAPTATGFSGTGNWFGTNANVIYIAIRRGPMKTPTSGTEVFAAATQTGSSTGTPTYISNFVVDFAFRRTFLNTTGTNTAQARLTGQTRMFPTNANAEGGEPDNTFYYMNGFGLGTTVTTNNIAWMFRRAPGFFDVAAYTGQSSTPNHNVPHNLGVAPELIIFKRRSGVKDWWVYSAPTGTGKVLYLNTNLAVSTDAGFIATTPTATEITTNSYAQIDNQGDTYIAYLFATLPGISKVGSYTGTATTQQINCGFTSGARFVLIKRTDSTGDWYVWDTARGIVSGNDPYLLLNSTAAEVTSTDYIDPYSAGFEISSTAPAAINASGGSFVFLAIA